MEFETWLDEAREELERSPELASAGGASPEPLKSGTVLEELTPLAEASPQAAVMEGMARVEQQLKMLVSGIDPQASQRVGPVGLARLAHSHGLLSEENMKAIEGLAVLRNLAAHGRAERLSPERAMEYLALVDGVLFALDRTSKRQAPGTARE